MRRFPRPNLNRRPNLRGLRGNGTGTFGSPAMATGTGTGIGTPIAGPNMAGPLAGVPRNALTTPTSGLAQINEARFRTWRDILGNQYSEDYFEYHLDFGDIAAGAGATATVNIEADSAFEWCLTATSNQTSGDTPTAGEENVVIQIADTTSSRQLFNQQVPAQHIAGAGGYLHPLPVKRLFVPQSTIIAQAQNYDSAVDLTDYSLSLIGRKIFFEPAARDAIVRNRFTSWIGEDGRTYAEDYAAYTFNIGDIANGSGVQPFSVQIEADSDFEWLQTWATGFFDDGTTGSLFTPALTWNIKSNSNGRYLFSDAISMQSNTGGAPGNGGALVGFPFVLPVPHLFKAKETITIDVENYDAAAWNSVYLTMEGRKIFDITD